MLNHNIGSTSTQTVKISEILEQTSLNSVRKILTDTVKISEILEQTSLNSVRKILTDTAIVQACQACKYKYRNRLLTPIVIVLHMIMSAIWTEDSFNASWQVMWLSMVSKKTNAKGKSPSRGTVSDGRNRLPMEVINKVFMYISQQAQKLSGQYDKWRGHRVVLVDGTCLSMPNEPSLQAEFGVPNGYHGKGRNPIARMVTLCLCNTMTVLSYKMSTYVSDENTLLCPLLKTLRKGDLLIADRHFAGANLYCRYLSEGIEFLTRAHQKLKISRIKRLYSYSTNDFVGYLKVGDNYRRKDTSLPAKIMVRFICATLPNRKKSSPIWFVTSLLDGDLYAADEIVQQYAHRWRIETLFRELKINFNADVLRSKTVPGIYKEIASRLTAINIVRSIMLEAAARNKVDDPLRISFVTAVRAIVSFSPALAFSPVTILPAIYNAMLDEIAAHLVPWRPGRTEPRKLARDPKSYPSLKQTRAEWRINHAA